MSLSVTSSVGCQKEVPSPVIKRVSLSIQALLVRVLKSRGEAGSDFAGKSKISF
jgi:hypothetical protein